MAWATKQNYIILHGWVVIWVSVSLLPKPRKHHLFKHYWSFVQWTRTWYVSECTDCKKSSSCMLELRSVPYTPKSPVTLSYDVDWRGSTGTITVWEPSNMQPRPSRIKCSKMNCLHYSALNSVSQIDFYWVTKAKMSWHDLEERKQEVRTMERFFPSFPHCQWEDKCTKMRFSCLW